MDVTLDYDTSFASEKLDTSNREPSDKVEDKNLKTSHAEETHKESDSEKETCSSSSGNEQEKGNEEKEKEDGREESMEVKEAEDESKKAENEIKKAEDETKEKDGESVEKGEVKEKTEEPIDTIELTSNEFENDLLGAPPVKVDAADKEDSGKVVTEKKEPPPVKTPVPCPKIHNRVFDIDAECQYDHKDKKWELKRPVDIITTDLLKDLVDIKLKKEEEETIETNLARGRRNRPLRSSEIKEKKKVVKKDEEEHEGKDEGLDYEMESEKESDSNDEREDNTKDPTAFPDAPAEPAPRSRKSRNRALLITNLIRPFTVLQLKTMLSHCGKVKSIWINTIKSRCYVVFASIEEATRARESLHGAVWPSTSPRLLTVDYAEDERMYSETDGELVGDNIDIQVIEEQKRKKPKKDKDKKEKADGNMLDDLFKKTKALPSIYWLPLDEEQAKKRETERAKSKPRYFEPEPLDEPDFPRQRAAPRWRTPDRGQRDDRRRDDIRRRR